MMEFCRVDKNYKKYQRLLNGIFFIIPAALCGAVIWLSYDFNFTLGYFISGAVLVLAAGLMTFPALNYSCFSYCINQNRVEIKSGVLNKNHALIPISKIQHISVTSGPVTRAFSIARLNVFTAGGVYHLDGLNIQKAEEISEQLKNSVLNKNDSGSKAECKEGAEK